MVNGSGVFIKTGGKFEVKSGQYVFMSGETVNAQLPKMPESGMYSMRFGLSQIFDPNILKNMKYKLINHSKKIEAEYEFEQESSARIYSDSINDIELELVSGAYMKEISELSNIDANPLDKEEMEDYGCGENHDHTPE